MEQWKDEPNWCFILFFSDLVDHKKPVCSQHGKVTVFSMESGVFGESDLAAVSGRILLFNKRSVGTLSTMSRKINHVEQSQPETKTNLK